MRRTEPNLTATDTTAPKRSTISSSSIVAGLPMETYSTLEIKGS